MKDQKPTVIDFFCGAGGFSEGFRQYGFEITMGIDNWQPAIDTFNFNFGLKCKTENILDYERSIKKIEELPDTEIIIGSPPCVTFSNSNNSGKADKSLGKKLTKIFLKIVAIKKYKSNSVLKAWFMENVVNSIKHLPDHYTFKDLGLTNWAIDNKLNPDSIAITIKGNYSIINSSDYGCSQNRIRAISGEIIPKKKFILPPFTHRPIGQNLNLPAPITLGFIKSALPKPNSKQSQSEIVDPSYPEIKIKQNELTDHFYDTGLYESEWRTSQYLKQNHPYMGKMSFPEDETKPSRTVTATKIGISREALIYKSEYSRVGNGEYRTGTVREAATLMSFPITFQFIGKETSKWRLVGNAVCPKVSGAFAKLVRESLGLSYIDRPIHNIVNGFNKVDNLNTYKIRKFNSPPKRNKGARFRRHPIKTGNMTVTLSNYDIKSKFKKTGKWQISIQYGTGEGFPIQQFRSDIHEIVKSKILSFENGEKFIDIINNGFSEKIAKGTSLQKMYENQKSKGKFLEPTLLVDKIGEIIKQYDFQDPNYKQKGKRIFTGKEDVPKKQFLALYAITKICTVANGKGKK